MTSTGDPPLRIGVIGTGRIGRMHAGIIANRVEGTALAAVADADPAAARAAASALGVPARSPEEIITGKDVDAVAVCSPTPTHVGYIIAACDAGKAVFCEKPISLDLGEVDRALEAVTRSGVPLMIGFNRRFDPSHAAVRAAVVKGEVGEVHVVHITSRDPEPPPLSYAKTSGGIFLDMTVHDFDMARFVTGSDVVEVYAAGAVRIEPGLAELGDVDTAVVTLVHDSGAITAIDNSMRATYGYDQRVEVLGDHGLASSHNHHVSSSTVADATGTHLPPLPYFFIERYAASYEAEWKAFARALAAGDDVPVGGRDGRAALTIGLAAGVSLREHRPVRISEIDTGSGTRAGTPTGKQGD